MTSISMNHYNCTSPKFDITLNYLPVSNLFWAGPLDGVLFCALSTNIALLSYERKLSLCCMNYFHLQEHTNLMILTYNAFLPCSEAD